MGIKFEDGYKPIPFLTQGEISEMEAVRRDDLRSKYKLPPEPTGLAGLYKKIPTNMRLLLENLVGKDTPITEKDFTNDELLQMVSDIERNTAFTSPTELKQQGVGVNAYAAPRGTRASEKFVDARYNDSLVRSFTDPRYTVATSLGRYDAEDLGNQLRIRDEYNFNKQQRDLPTDPLSVLQHVFYSPELAGEYFANFIGTPDRDVDIAIDKIIND